MWSEIDEPPTPWYSYVWIACDCVVLKKHLNTNIGNFLKTFSFAIIGAVPLVLWSVSQKHNVDNFKPK